MLNLINFFLLYFAITGCFQSESLSMKIENDNNDVTNFRKLRITKEEFNNTSQIMKMNYLYDMSEENTDNNVNRVRITKEEFNLSWVEFPAACGERFL